MAEIITTKGISYYLEEIITGADSELFLASPYLKLSSSLYERLESAARKNIQINIVYGKEELYEYEWKSLTTLNNLILYFKNDLHAKCYFNESMMIITSMNLHEFSEKNNRELGILILKDQDEKLYARASEEICDIISHSKRELFNVIESNTPPTSDASSQERGEHSVYEDPNFNNKDLDELLLDRLHLFRNVLSKEEGINSSNIFTYKTLEEFARQIPRTSADFGKIYGVGPYKLEKYGTLFVKEIDDHCMNKMNGVFGFCIRCGRKISYKPGQPFCKSCFYSWVGFANSDYQENYCHRCGKTAESSMNKPLCDVCMKNGK